MELQPIDRDVTVCSFNQNGVAIVLRTRAHYQNTFFLQDGDKSQVLNCDRANALTMWEEAVSAQKRKSQMEVVDDEDVAGLLRRYGTLGGLCDRQR